jgi:hypothetical protein
MDANKVLPSTHVLPVVLSIINVCKTLSESWRAVAWLRRTKTKPNRSKRVEDASLTPSNRADPDRIPRCKNSEGRIRSVRFQAVCTRSILFANSFPSTMPILRFFRTPSTTSSKIVSNTTREMLKREVSEFWHFLFSLENQLDMTRVHTHCSNRSVPSKTLARSFLHFGRPPQRHYNRRVDHWQSFDNIFSCSYSLVVL